MLYKELSGSQVLIYLKQSENEIIVSANKLNNKMTSGSDSIIPSFIVKDCINVLTTPDTYILFSVFLKMSVFPNW